jgi:NADH-quinone oxidoreductase subunit I
MSLKTAVRDTLVGFKSLITGMRITAREASKPIITVQYPHETLKMPDRFRGHVKLILDPETGKSRCTACNLCVRACPSDCIEVDGIKREGEKKKSVTEYKLDFTTCSLCGSCVEACPSDAIEYSKQYNAVSTNREDFGRIDIYKNFETEAKKWAETHPAPPAAAAPAPTPGSATPATPNAAPVAAAPVVAGLAEAGRTPAAPPPTPGSTTSATPNAAPTSPTPPATATAQPQAPQSKTT